MAAFIPVPPCRVTDSSMVRSCWAVPADITGMPAGWAVGCTVPSGVVVDCTTRGGIRTPPLATVWYIEASCSEVIATPCPIGRFAKVASDQLANGGSRPALSPGSSMPVGWPSPNRCR